MIYFSLLLFLKMMIALASMKISLNSIFFFLLIHWIAPEKMVLGISSEKRLPGSSDFY